MMTKKQRLAVVTVLATLGGIALVGALNRTVKEYRQPTPYKTVARRVMPGDTLWDICLKASKGQEDVRDVVDRARLDNDITDPGTLQIGQVITIRVKE